MQEKRRRTSERILREKQKRERERSEMALEKARLAETLFIINVSYHKESSSA